MTTDAYSILVEPRPCRIAYLVRKGDGDTIDDVIEQTRRYWGGRYNPILEVEESDLSSAAWTFLRGFDPDFIVARTPIGDALRRRIATFLTPIMVVVARDDDDPTHLPSEPVGVAPNARSVKVVGHDFFRAESKLVLFSVTADAPEFVRDFVIRNFSRMHGGQGSWMSDAQALQELTPRAYVIGSVEALRDALLELSDYRRVVYASQLCALGDSLPDPTHRYAADHFAVIVGDQPDDIAFAWNRIAATPQWLRTGFTQLWLSAAIARDATLRPALSKFIRRYVDSTGNQNSKGALFQSRSLEKAELETISQGLGGGVAYLRRVEQVEAVPKFEVWDHEPFSTRPRETRQHIRGYTAEEHISIDGPPTELTPTGSVWFADVYVQQQNQDDDYRPPRSLWWRLPPRAGLLSRLRFFDREARIRRNGAPSVQMERQKLWGGADDQVIVRIPSSERLAYALLCAPHPAFGDDEDEAKEPESTFVRTAPSDKGRYLEGVIRLFPGLASANQALRSRLWRRVFELMSNNDIAKTEERRTRVVNRLKKDAANWTTDFSREKGLERFASFVLQLARQQANDAKELRFDEIRDLALTEIEEHNAHSPGDKLYAASTQALSNLDRELSGDLAYLVRRGVLQVGLRPQCPHCGTTLWYHVDDVIQSLTCKGCTAQYTLAPEEPWHYQLNSLMRAAVALHGTLPVLLVLGQLRRGARNSFVFAPPTDVFAKRRNESRRQRPESDVDILCLKDGRFIIGEVKASADLFKASVFDSMLRVAKAVRPDRMIFSALEGKRSKLIDDHLARLSAELADLEVMVEWYPLDSWVTNPDPPRFLLCDVPPPMPPDASPGPDATPSLVTPPSAGSVPSESAPPPS